MKNILKKAALALAFIVSFTTNAQNDNSLLWEVTGNGLTNPSYIFGTIHMICEEDYIMTPVIEEKLKSVDQFYAEIDFSNMADMMEMQKAMQADIPLSKRIDADKYSHLKDLLYNTFKIDVTEYEYLSDMAIVSTITFKSFPCEKHKMYEMELLQKSMLQQKKLGGLETIKEQMDVMSDSFTIDTLISMLEEFAENKFDATNKMVDLYKQQQIDQLLDFTKTASYMDEKTYHSILVNRNENWIKQLPKIMKNKTTFFAVGAAHLGGKEGILELLRNEGYVVKPIKI